MRGFFRSGTLCLSILLVGDSPVLAAAALRTPGPERSAMNQRAILLIVLFVALIGGLGALLSQSGDVTSDSPPELSIAAGSGAEDAGSGGDLPTIAAGGGARDVAPLPIMIAEQGRAVAELAASGAAEEPQGSFTGRVVGPHGEPVDGAHVTLSRDFGNANMFSPRRGKEPVLTDAEGRFRVGRLTARSMRVVVTAGGYAQLSESIERPKGADESDIGVFTLDLGVVLRGFVQDFHGRPVGDAEVLLQPERAGLEIFILGSASNLQLRTRTGSDGSFVLDSVAVGPWTIRVDHDLHPSARMSGASERPGVEPNLVQVRLGEGGSAAGRVIGLRPEQECVVVARRQRQGDLLGLNFQRTAQVGTDGEFEIHGLDVDADYQFVVQEEAGHLGFGQDLSEGVAGRAGQMGLIIEVRGSRGLEFRVVSAATGAPVEAFQAKAGGWWMKELRDPDGKVVTNHPDGRAQFLDVENQLGSDSGVNLLIVADGYEDHTREGLRLRDGEVLDLGEIALLAAPVLRVRVLEDADGEPVKGARVTLKRTARNGLGKGFSIGGDFEMASVARAFDVTGGNANRSARTDAGGWVSLTTIPGVECSLSVKHGKFADLKRAPQVYGGGELEVRLLSGGTVRVIVLAADGTQAGKTQVTHRALRDGMSERRGGVMTKSTGSKGRVAFQHLAAGTHGFRLADQGASGAMMTIVIGLEEAGPRPGEAWELVEVEEGSEHEVVLHAPQEGVLLGRVTEGGSPLVGATLRLEAWSGDGKDAEEARARSRSFGMFVGTAGVRTKGDGSFRMEAKTVGEYELIITHHSREMDDYVRVSVRAGETEVSVDLPATAIEGVVVDDGGRPVAGASVVVRRPGEKSFGGGVAMVFQSSGSEQVSFGPGVAGGKGKTDAEGRFRLKGLAAECALELYVSKGSSQPRTLEIEPLRPDEVRTGLRVVLEEGGSVEAMMLMADGKDAEFGSLVLTKIVDGDVEGEVRHAGAHQGAAKLDGLAPGKWRAVATVFDLSNLGGGGGDPQNSEQVQTVEVVLGEVTQLLFQF